MRLLPAFVVLAVPGLLAACAHQQPRSGGPPGPAGVRAHDTAVSSGSVDNEIRDDTSLPQSRRYARQRDGGPDHPAVDVNSLPEPVPTVEPRSRYGNKSPYEVLGETYRVLERADGYDERGNASWYGNKFDGHMTSSFERYDMYKFTAAHKTLPLPSYARVTNLENGKSVIVRINDRGPFHKNRLIDLSYAAAVRIGIWPKGTGRVEVRALDPRHPQELPPPAAVTARDGSGKVFLQVGAFADAANAARVVALLRRAHIAPVRILDSDVGNRRLSRVRVGPLQNAAQADRMSQRIQRLGLPRPQVAVK